MRHLGETLFCVSFWEPLRLIFEMENVWFPRGYLSKMTFFVLTAFFYDAEPDRTRCSVNFWTPRA